MTYSFDFRKRVFDEKQEKGLTFEETSQRFDVPVRTLFRWSQRLSPQTKRNKPATKIDMERLAEHVKDYPDAYLWERALYFNVKTQTIFYALKRLGVCYRKKDRTPKGRRRGIYQLEVEQNVNDKT